MSDHGIQEEPIQKYILERFADFSDECKRLRDKGPIIEYKALVDSFQLIVTKLGDLEHEVALATLNKEFRAASREAREAWSGIWRKFHEHRQRAKILDVEHKARQKEEAQLIAELEKSYSEFDDDFPEMKASLRSCLDAMKVAADVDLNPGTMWRSGSWHFLLVDLYGLSVYVRYYFAKGAFFVFRHSFIVITSIILLGLAMSRVSGEISKILTQLNPQWPWVGAAVAIFWSWMKKYYVDPKMKRLQTKLETRRLRPLAFHVHLARTMALYSRTLERR